MFSSWMLCKASLGLHAVLLQTSSHNLDKTFDQACYFYPLSASLGSTSLMDFGGRVPLPSQISSWARLTLRVAHIWSLEKTHTQMTSMWVVIVQQAQPYLQSLSPSTTGNLYQVLRMAQLKLCPHQSSNKRVGSPQPSLFQGFHFIAQISPVISSQTFFFTVQSLFRFLIQLKYPKVVDIVVEYFFVNSASWAGTSLWYSRIIISWWLGGHKSANIFFYKFQPEVTPGIGSD